ncbi:ParB/RepB/Spo0J family partition protein [Lentzea sp. NPDC102401]|uniref:ParB/RepB/Spo0J family partition protein n=1 Tax=Lentzea sp. NPDC102401 TaxID=3364128 RepID=UPI00382E7F7C
MTIVENPAETGVILLGQSGAGEVLSVPIALLHTADSPRLQAEDPDYVRMLTQVEGELPPIVVHRPTMRVVDGMHRVRAALLRGDDRIAVRFVDLPEEDLFLLAVRLNADHGMPLSPADRRAAAVRILGSHPHLSDRAVAAATGLASKTVRNVRAQHGASSSASQTRIGRDGRRRPLSAAEGRRSAGALIRADPRTPLRQIAKQAGISLGTAADVRDRVLRGENPVPGEERTGTAAAGVEEGASVESDSHTAAPVVSTQRRVPLPEFGGQRDAAVVMRILVSDPSLRFTQSGREMLRWLSTRVIDPQDWRALVDEMPAHCTGTVADLARRCSDTWRDFADELERRHRTSA